MAHNVAYKISRRLSQAILLKEHITFLNSHIRQKSNFPLKTFKKPIEPIVKSSGLPTKNNNEGFKIEPSPTYKNIKFNLKRFEKNAENDTSSNLRPALLQDYYSSTIKVENVPFPETKVQNKKFAKSNTHSALTMPLKLSRLANPFPDSVSVLPSQTVSDQEKAEQMELERKMDAKFKQEMAQEKVQEEQKNHLNKKNERGSNKRNTPNSYLNQQRFYSTNAFHKSNSMLFAKTTKNAVAIRKYAKKKKKQPSCPKRPTPGCEEAHEGCEYGLQPPPCKKKNAPYPAYSECIEEPYREDADECKDCPWTTMPSNTGRRDYCTSCSKKVTPCEDPHCGKTPCDYEKTAQNKKRRPKKDKDKPVKKADADDSQIQQVSFGSKVKGWLNQWGTESENVKVLKPDMTEPGKETSVVEIYDIAEKPEPNEVVIVAEASDAVSVDIPVPQVPKAMDHEKGKSPGKKPEKKTCDAPSASVEEKKEKEKVLPKLKKLTKIHACEEPKKTSSISRQLISEIKYADKFGKQEEIVYNGIELPTKPVTTVFKLKKEYWKKTPKSRRNR